MFDIPQVKREIMGKIRKDSLATSHHARCVRKKKNKNTI
jgi:hypothetical protein